ncbi:MAG TPA: pyruvate synthase, partial [Candidatus Bathyarchaeia archaeon]|nr:pyruvate synthase [Candidatus Bathyarchaeia archaeon]
FIHCLNPCPKGWDFDPMLAYEIGHLAVNTGIWPLYEVEKGELKLYGKTREIAEGRFKRLPVADYLLKQGRFAHFTNEDVEFFQSQVDDMWNNWLIPGVIPLRKQAASTAPAA